MDDIEAKVRAHIAATATQNPMMAKWKSLVTPEEWQKVLDGLYEGSQLYAEAIELGWKEPLDS